LRAVESVNIMRPWSSGKRYCVVRRAPTIARPDLQTPDAIPESIKATENQQHPCDPVHKRELITLPANGALVRTEGSWGLFGQGVNDTI